MRLYAGMSKEFIDETIHNRIADLLKTAFESHYRRQPSPSEVQSWRNSLRAVSQVFQYAGPTDHGVILEYELPVTSMRLDCLVCGAGVARDSASIIELKQWERCEDSEGEHVVTWVGGGHREVLHPSAQVDRYRQQLSDNHSAFYEEPDPIALQSCAYLHNYTPVPNDTLFLPKFDSFLLESPIYTADKVDALASALSMAMIRGDGKRVLDRIERGTQKPSKKLLNEVARVIKGEHAFVLLDDQLVAYDMILAAARKAGTVDTKEVFIIHGGPGTGKSAIAINLMADLSRAGKNAQYATGSRTFTGTLRKILGPRTAQQFRYFNNYGEAAENQVDVLICDEAHRIRATSANQYTARSRRSGKPQLQELLDAGRVPVFFIDDKQTVRPGEVGSSPYIREVAEANG